MYTGRLMASTNYFKPRKTYRVCYTLQLGNQKKEKRKYQRLMRDARVLEARVQADDCPWTIHLPEPIIAQNERVVIPRCRRNATKHSTREIAAIQSTMHLHVFSQWHNAQT